MAGDNGKSRRTRALAGALAIVVLIPLLITVPFVSSVTAAPADFDATFGVGGRVITDLAGDQFGQEVVLEPSGNIILAGFTVEPAYDFMVTRYRPDGSLDPTFGTNGHAFTDFGGSDSAQAVVRQPDGKIVVAGRSLQGGRQLFAVARYNPNGSLDTSFATGGKRTISPSARDNIVFAMGLQADGRIVLGGIINSSPTPGVTSSDFGIVRLESNGTLDSTFDGDGIVTTDFGGDNDLIADLVVAPDQSIVVAGFAGSGPVDQTATQWAAARYLPDGSLDTTFDGDGRWIRDLGTGSNAQDLLVDALGRLVLAGQAGDLNSDREAAVVRLLASGADDTGFGTGGVVRSVGDAGTEVFYEIALQQNGKIVVAGIDSRAGFDAGDVDGYVVRLLDSGALDPAFGGDGAQHVSWSSGSDIIGGLAVQPDGRIVVGGETGVSGDNDVALARLEGDPIPLTAPLAGRIVWADEGDGDLDLYETPVTGGVPTALTANNTYDAYPHFSRDGRRIAFERITDDNYEIFVRDEAGNETRLTENAAYDGLPSWSPDGSKLAFVSDRTDELRLYTMDADGTDPAPVGTFAIADGFGRPSWSPDGRYLVYYEGFAEASELWITDLEGNRRQVTDNAVADFDPQWSPDGQTILFQGGSTGVEAPNDVLAVRPDGSGYRTLLSLPESNEGVAQWSPDGDWIVFHSDIDGDDDIYVSRADGTGSLIPISDEVEGELPHRDLTPTWAIDETFSITSAAGVVNASTTKLPVADLPLSPNSPEQLGSGLPSLDITGSPLTSLDITGSPLPSLDITGSPLPSLDITGSPLPSLDITGSPLPSLDITGSPLPSLDITGSPSVLELQETLPLAETPVLRPGGWEAVTEGRLKVPLQTATWRDVIELSPRPAAFANLEYRDIDWSRSRLRKLDAFALALGQDTFRQFAPPAPGWCTRFESLGFVNCGAAFGGLDGTVFGFQAAGGSPRDLPLAAMPLSSLKLRKAAILDLQLSAIHRTTGLRSTPFGAVLLRELPDPNLVADCGLLNCSSNSDLSVADAGAQSKLRASASVRHLGSFDGGGNFVAIERLRGLGLGELVLTLLPLSQVPVEQLDVLPILGGYTGPGSTRVAYTISFWNVPAGADESPNTIDAPTITASLPDSFRYVPGTSRLVTAGVGGVETSATLADPIRVGNELSWSLIGRSVADGERIQIRFDSLPGLTLGTFHASASILASGVAQQTGPRQAPVGVLDAYEVNDDPATAPFLPADTVIVDHLPAGDVDYFRVQVPTYSNGKPRIGDQMTMFAGHFSADHDLVVYLPEGVESAAPLRDAVPSVRVHGADLETPGLTGSGLPSLDITGSPLPSLDITGSPIGDHVPTINGADESKEPQNLEDIPLLAGRAVAGISAARALDAEAVDFLIPDGVQAGDSFLVQVTSYNGGGSDRPFTLRYTTTHQQVLPACAPRAFAHMTGAPLPPTASIPLDTKTIFLMSGRRLGRTYGAGATTTVLNAMSDEFLARADVKGAIVSLDDVATDGSAGPIARAFAAHDAEPCRPETANDVVRAINGLVNTLLMQGGDHNDVTSIVVVGGDDLVPHARIPDLTEAFNERTYTSSVEFTGVDGGNPTKSNAITGALGRGYLLSDAPFGDLNPTPYPGGHLYVPEWAVGRLVETPADIATSITRFVSSDGRLNPTSALTAGYDFSNDLADAVNAGLTGVTQTRDVLKGETWTKQDITSRVTANANPPSIININGHYNHFAAAPAALNAGLSTEPFTTTDVKNGGSLLDRLVFSMSCHAALNLSDVMIGNPTDAQRTKLADWPQTYQAKSAAFLVGPTGYSYGSRNTLGYSERVIAFFAEELKKGKRVGDAFVTAQKRYKAGLGVISVYDDKVLEEMVFFGLPLYTLAGTAAVTAPVNTPVETEPGTGLQKTTVTADFGTGSRALAKRTGPDGVFYTAGSELPQATPNNPLTAASSFDVSSTGRALAGALIVGLQSTDEADQNPAIERGIVDSSANEPEPLGSGVFPNAPQRVHNEIGPSGLKSSLVLMPTQTRITGENANGSVATIRKFTSIVAEAYYAAPGATGGTTAHFTKIKPVVTPGNLQLSAEIADASPTPAGITRALAMVHDGPTWKPMPLTQDGSGTWSGSLAITSTKVELFVQAVTDKGYVIRSLNKGSYYGDTVAPSVRIDNPAEDATFLLNQVVRASYRCSDAGGVALCKGSVANGATLPTGTVGEHELAVVAVDGAGNEVRVTRKYRVLFDFGGFYSPVQNLPTVNEVSGGRTIPLKWSLKDAAGASYANLKSVKGLTFFNIDCGTRQPLGLTLDLLLIPGTLKYDASTGRYQYNADAKLVPAGSCQRLVLTLDDGQPHMADFKFK